MKKLFSAILVAASLLFLSSCNGLNNNGPKLTIEGNNWMSADKYTDAGYGFNSELQKDSLIMLFRVKDSGFIKYLNDEYGSEETFKDNIVYWTSIGKTKYNPTNLKEGSINITFCFGGKESGKSIFYYKDFDGLKFKASEIPEGEDRSPEYETEFFLLQNSIPSTKQAEYVKLPATEFAKTVLAIGINVKAYEESK
ncbi:MAG: hypothetical protein HUJ95_04700 [Bacteroidales bacterium]|nr:hypothetical protein [Bacteroidales bacterium]